jgi:hypothetical protein
MMAPESAPDVTAPVIAKELPLMVDRLRVGRKDMLLVERTVALATATIVIDSGRRH